MILKTPETMNENIFTLSTAHIQADTNELFEELCHKVGEDPELRNSLCFRVATHHYGWILFIRHEPDSDEQRQLIDNRTPELDPIFDLARKNQAFIINFDRDAEEYSDLETFDW